MRYLRMKIRHDNILMSIPVDWDMIKETDIILGENGLLIINNNCYETTVLLESLCIDIAEEKEWVFYNKDDVKLSFLIRRVNENLIIFIEVQIKPAIWMQSERESIIKATCNEISEYDKTFYLEIFEKSDEFYNSPHENDYESKCYKILPTQSELKKFTHLYEQKIHI
jgi:hypothetical protein